MPGSRPKTPLSPTLRAAAGPPRPLSTALAAALALLLGPGLLAVAPSATSAQLVGERPRGLYLGIQGEAIFGTSAEFSEQHVCPSENVGAASARAGYRVNSLLSLEASGSYVFENPDFCVNGLLPPPPENGTVERTVYDEDIEGYPHVALDARVLLEPFDTGEIVVPHIAAGGGWFPSKGIVHLLAGLGLRVGSGPFRGTLDVEGLWFDVPFDRVRTTYRDGEVVSVERTPGETSESPIRIRAGVVYYP